MDYENNVYEKTCAGCGKQFFHSNIRTKYCSPKCRDHNYYVNVKKKRGNLGEEGRKAKLDEYIASQIPQGFKYVSGYTGSDSTIVLRCDKCGGEFECSFTTIRHQHRINCKNCSKKKREEQEAKRQEEMEILRSEKRAARLKAKEEEERKRWHYVVCACCGETFETNMKRTICCSENCKRRYANRKGKAVRDARIEDGKLIDKDITLESLYKRDAGVCYLCGCKCSYEDYVVRDGAFIAGDWYPSVDHVMPLSKGGTHAWDNVRLAHRRCNYLKGDRVLTDDGDIQKVSSL